MLAVPPALVLTSCSVTPSSMKFIEPLGPSKCNNKTVLLSPVKALVGTVYEAVYLAAPLQILRSSI